MANDKCIIVQVIKFILKWVKIMLEKGGNAVYQHFLLSQQCFSRSCLENSVVKEQIMTNLKFCHMMKQ